MLLPTIGYDISNLERQFHQVFGDAEPMIVRSPGRVNFLGEHTDYNEGFVLPAALDKAMYFAVSGRNDTALRFFSLDMNDMYEGNLASITRSPKGWPNYLLGVIGQLLQKGYDIGGINCAFAGDIPIGAGLSSSAAIEGGFIFALNTLFDLGMNKLTMIKLGQKAENEFVGVQCGIMDQFVNMLGEENNVLKIDCRSLAYEQIPFESSDMTIILCETQKRRELASSEYNVRRKQCEEGVAVISRTHPSIHSLRDVSIEMLESAKSLMTPVVYQRCGYVVRENNRVLDACLDLQRRDFSAFGRKMFETHAGLSKEYEVSSRSLDTLVELASGMEGVVGSRMMGAGFGGCTINLVYEGVCDQFINIIHEQFEKRTNEKLKIHIAKLKSGTEQIN